MSYFVQFGPFLASTYPRFAAFRLEFSPAAYLGPRGCPNRDMHPTIFIPGYSGTFWNVAWV
jgi:hypothetical protein